MSDHAAPTTTKPSPLEDDLKEQNMEDFASGASGDESDEDSDVEDISLDKELILGQQERLKLIQARMRDPAPEAIRAVHQELFPIAREWWSAKSEYFKPEDKERIDAANSKLRGIGKELSPPNELGFQFPGHPLFLHVRSLVGLVDKPKKSQECGTRMFETFGMLKSKGIHWRDIFTPEQTSRLLSTAGQAKDPSLTKLVTGPTPEQLVVLKKAPLDQVLDLVKRKNKIDQEKRQEIVATVMRVNIDLEAINRQNNFPIKDHKLPLEQIEKLLAVAKKPEKAEKLYAEIDKQVDFGLYTDSPPPYEPPSDTKVTTTDIKVDQNDGPPPYKAVAVAVPVAEELGRIVHVRSAGRGTRVVIQRGTNQYPAYSYVSGSLLSKQAVKAVQDRQDEQDTKAPLMSKDTHPAAVLFVELPKVNQESTRRELGLFGIIVNENGSDKLRFATRSEALRAKGKIWTEKTIKELQETAAQNEKYLEWFKERDLHPDTKKQLTQADKKSMPWLAKGAALPNQITIVTEQQSRLRQYLRGDGEGYNTRSTG